MPATHQSHTTKQLLVQLPATKKQLLVQLPGIAKQLLVQLPEIAKQLLVQLPTKQLLVQPPTKQLLVQLPAMMQLRNVEACTRDPRQNLGNHRLATRRRMQGASSLYEVSRAARFRYKPRGPNRYGYGYT